jgi:hypothetical protein
MFLETVLNYETSVKILSMSENEGVRILKFIISWYHDRTMDV